MLSPAWQVDPSQQPVQQLPSWQRPPVQGEPSGFAAPLQVPATQVPVVQPVTPDVQSWQAAPAAPQAVSEVPSWQTVPSQQPVHWLVGQVPPQPSSAPAHLPMHWGGQPQVPEEVQEVPGAQVPQEPPQPSLPHSLPTQSGTHPLQVPWSQVLPSWLQSTQVAPLLPQALSERPSRHSEPLALQQPGQVRESQMQLPATHIMP
jgi:hypothetical protein